MYGFMEAQRRDTEIRPEATDREGLEKMMLEFSFETQLASKWSKRTYSKLIYVGGVKKQNSTKVR